MRINNLLLKRRGTNYSEKISTSIYLKYYFDKDCQKGVYVLK